MSWTDGEPFVWTAVMSDLPWKGARTRAEKMKAVACGLCDKEPKPGDTWRWQMVHGAPNIFVCAACDLGWDETTRVWEHRWYDTIQPILKRWGNRE